MSKNLIILCFLLSSSFMSHSQRKDATSSAQQNYLVVEGGGLAVRIDTTISLDSLINRLAKPWQFAETGKANWIGYTEDMYSIAARGVRAIQPLVNVLQDSTHSYARYGAIYCLHLIGINSTIIGRFSEKFVKVEARNALLQFLDDPFLQEDIMRLLIRDPWPSDIPHIIATMKNCAADCWSLVNGLTRYKIERFPLRQQLPDALKAISINVTIADDFSPQLNFDRQIKEALDSFRNLNLQTIHIEDNLFKNTLVGDFASHLWHPVTIENFFAQLDLDKYSGLGSRIQYYVKGENLFIISSETARRHVIDWWTRLPDSEKERYKMGE